MEQYKTEIEYCNRMGYHPNDAEEKIQLAKMFAEFKSHIIEQAKKDKLTFPNCKDEVAKLWGHTCFTSASRLISVNGLIDLMDEAAEMYANQVTPVAPAEKMYHQVMEFAKSMNYELVSNEPVKGKRWQKWYDIDKMIEELRYHEDKLLSALDSGDEDKIKEHLADCGNFLMFIGNAFGLYESNSKP